MLRNRMESCTKFDKVSLLSSLFFALINYGFTAMAEPAHKAAASSSGGSTMIIAGGAGVIVIGAIAFVVMSKKSGSKESVAKSNLKPHATQTSAPAHKNPISAPNLKSAISTPAPKSPTSTTASTGPLQPFEMPSSMPTMQQQAPKFEPVKPVTPVINSTPETVAHVSTPQSSGGGLFDSNKLSSDLDSIFKDESVKTESAAQKKSPLFDSAQLDNDLDSLFTEVNKKAEPKKEEKVSSGLFDSSQLDNDLDSLFSSPSPIKQNTPEPTPASAPAFNLDSLDFLSSPSTPEVKNEPLMSSPALDLSSLSNSSSSQSSSVAFDLDSLDFLSSPSAPKSDQAKNDSFTLPSFDLSSLTSSNKPSPSADLSSLSKNADKIDLSTTTMGINISEYLTSINTPTPAVEEKKDNVISIGKMTVDQNALEEIIKKAEQGGKAGLTTTQVITAVKGKTLDTLLVDINNVQGIKGSMIVGKDGLVIANTMSEDVDKDLIGALTSSLFSNIDNQLKKVKKGNLKKLTVETELGIYILTEIDMGTLIVFSEDKQKINFSNTFKAIAGVTGKK